MSSPQILFAAAGVGGGPPPPAGPAFVPTGTGFSQAGPATRPAGAPFWQVEWIDFTSVGGITIYNTLTPSASGPTAWDATGGTYAATTGVTLNITGASVIPLVGMPMAQLTWSYGSVLPGAYIIDGGGSGGGINTGATMGMDLFVMSSSPGNLVHIVVNGSFDLVDSATRTTIYSSASFTIDVFLNFI